MELVGGVDLDEGGLFAELCDERVADGGALVPEGGDDAEPGVTGDLLGAVLPEAPEGGRGAGDLGGLLRAGACLGLAGVVDPDEGALGVEASAELGVERREGFGGDGEVAFCDLGIGLQEAAVEGAAGEGLDGVVHAVLRTQHDGWDAAGEACEEGAVEAGDADGGEVAGDGGFVVREGRGECVVGGDHGRELLLVADEDRSTREVDGGQREGLDEL